MLMHIEFIDILHLSALQFNHVRLSFCSKDRNNISHHHGLHTRPFLTLLLLQNTMNKNIEQTQDHQELEIIKAVAQAWLGHTATTSPSSSTNEFDARRLNFKTSPTRFKLEAMNKPSRVNWDNGLSTSWDFKQSLWDSYEIVAVSRRLETGLLLDNEFNELSKRKKESKNSLRSLLNQTSRRFDLPN